MTEKLQRWDVGEEGSWHDEDGDWCASPDVAELEARVAELEAALKPMTEGTIYITSEHIQEAYRLLGKRYPF